MLRTPRSIHIRNSSTTPTVCVGVKWPAADSLCWATDAGGVAGTAVAVILARVVDALAVTYLPPFPFKPESFFTHPLSVLLGGVGLGLFAALAGAYFPSRSAASVNPARALAE